MARIQDVRVSPILGISTLPQIKRVEGLANKQENFRANNTQGLNRRPPLEIEKSLLNDNPIVKHFWYTRKGLNYNLIISQSGLLTIWINDVIHQTNSLPTAYFNPSLHDVTTLILEEINDTVFIVNPEISVQMDTLITGYYNQPTHINITTALNYEDTLTMQASRITSTGEVLFTKTISHIVTPIDYSVTTTVDYSIADLSRATHTVAADICRQLNESVWGGFLKNVSVMFNLIKYSADGLIKYGTEKGYTDYITGGTAWLTGMDEVTTEINTLLTTMENLYGGGVSVARAALISAQTAESIARLAHDTAVSNLALDPLDPVLIALEVSTLADLTAAIAFTATKQTILDGLINPADYTTLWNQFSTIIPHIDALVYNVIAWGNMVLNSGYVSVTELNIIVSYLTNLKAEYNAGEVPLEQISSGTFRAYVLGTNISVYAIGVGTTDTVKIEITSGQGDKQAVVIHPVTADITSMPKYAINGSIVTVNPDPQNAQKGKNNGVYYMMAAPVNKVPLGTMTEVIWQETVSPWIKNKLNFDTMPVSILLEPLIKYSWIEGEKWRPREKGDDTSCPNPSFIGERINSIGYFQKRLVFLSANNVIMSETDDIWNFFKASAVKLFVTDPIDIASSAPGVDQIKFITPHNRDMLVTSKNAQFKIPGNAPITPETVSMALTTRYIMEDTVKPVSAGNYVYFAINYGKSSGLFEYTAQPYTGQDMSGELTNNVIGYMKGNMTMIAANETQHVIACRTTGCLQNQLFIDDRFMYGQGKWNSWSTWFLPPSNEIVDMYMSSDYLHVVIRESSGVNTTVPLPPNTSYGTYDLTGSEYSLFKFDTSTTLDVSPNPVLNPASTAATDGGYITTGLHGNGLTNGEFFSTFLNVGSWNDSPEWTIRLQLKMTDNVNGRIIDNASFAQFIGIQSGEILCMGYHTGIFPPGDNTWHEVSIEKLGGFVRGYWDGTLLHSELASVFTWLGSFVVLDMYGESTRVIDDLLLLNGHALAQGLGSYTTTVFNPPPTYSNGIILKKLKLFKEIEEGDNLVHLDDQIRSSGTNIFAFPIGWYKASDADNMTLVTTGDCKKPWTSIPFTYELAGAYLICTVSYDDYYNFIRIPGHEGYSVILGKNFMSRYEPSIIYRRDNGDTGLSLVRGKIRITNIYLSVSNSFSATMHKYGLGITPSWETKIAPELDVNDYRGLPNFTGNWGYYFSEDMLNASMDFETSSHLGLTINEISWEGQFHNVAKGI